MQPHIIDEIAQVLASQHQLGTLSSFAQTCRAVYESSVNALYETVNWDELDIAAKRGDLEDDGPPYHQPASFLSTFVQGYARGKVPIPQALNVPDALGSIK